MPIPAGLVLLAASAAVKYANDQDALRRQGKLAQAMAAYQRRKSGEAMVATEDMLKKQTTEARGTELAQVTRDREQSLRDTVGAAQAFDAPAGTGKVSGDYRAAQEQEANTIAERTRRAITQLAAMGAPGEQKVQHQLRFGKAAGAVDAANAASENVGGVYRTSIANTRPDPFADMLSTVGMAAGGGMMGGSGAEAPMAAGMGANTRPDPFVDMLSTVGMAAGGGMMGGSGAEAPMAAGMGADSTGNFNYEDSAGNTQRSSMPYKRRAQINRGFSLWGSR